MIGFELKNDSKILQSFLVQIIQILDAVIFVRERQRTTRGAQINPNFSRSTLCLSLLCTRRIV